MKYLSIFAVSLLILISLSSSTWSEELKKINLDDISSVGLRIETDTKIKTEGTGSLKITTQWPTTVCIAEVTDVEIENAKLVYRARIKSDFEGTGFLEMWVQINGGKYFSRGLNSTITGNVDWKTVETPFFLKKGQKPEKIYLNVVINGIGTVWLDDVVLLKETLK
ncbi:hypothetical protein ACFL27_01925 [candidate division CSSED10-310 bacterium]|uniref:CBM-cenC domain-containing protein n=1 Tax=candidate division CSSED10-310 bacterium TaxID=2855610 RepID=A0ABV6YRW3_UNCC1